MRKDHGAYSFLRRCVPLFASQPHRHLNLQEYQSKELMAEAGVNVQRFQMADTEEEGTAAGTHLLGTVAKELVIKAQILAGGRGKGVFDSGFKGGVHLTKDPSAAGNLVKNMIGHSLVTKQTPPGGVKVQKVMVAEALDIARETYLAIVMDRDHNGPVMIGSPMGGMDIEEVAASNPEAIRTDPIDIMTGITDAQANAMAEFLKFEGSLVEEAAAQIKALYELLGRVDATLLEVNPFGETDDGRVVCFDAKLNFDDNASFRQKRVFGMDDMAESDPREVKAAEFDLNYIAMDGNIACLVNGAGLAMATMDIIQLYGGMPANFLDVGGGVTEAKVKEAFNLLLADKQVESVLVNIFGGIVNCATIANGITAAAQSIDLKVPLIVRLEGTNVEEAKRIMANSGLPIISAEDLDDAAQKAVASLKR